MYHPQIVVIFVTMHKKPTVFLESHHLKNPYFGFGQFNYHLISALSNLSFNDYQIKLHVKNVAKWKNEFQDSFTYKKYLSIRRYPKARIRKKYELWHSLNQNTRVEPYHDIPYLLTVHNITYIKNLESYKDEEVHKRFQEKLNRSSAVTYISEYAKTSTHEFFSVPKVPEQVIYNGNTIEDLPFPQNYNLRKDKVKPFLFSIGEFTARKNFKTLVAMLEYLPDFDLVIAGKNSTKEADKIRELIQKMGLSNRVTLPGKISELDKQWYYKNCTAFVFPSLREGFGLPIIEAMHFGKPVIASHNTSLPEIGGDVAFYWQSHDPKEMATILEKSISTFQKDPSSIEESKKRASSFSWDTAANSYNHLYKHLLDI